MTGNISLEDQRSFNAQLVATLEQLDIPYAIGGSVAAMVYSEHRFTVDIDLMIDPTLEIEIPHHMPFNVIDGLRGTRADFYVARPGGIDASAMARRRWMQLYPSPETFAWFLSPEDVILYKLDYFRQSGETSAKHPADIAKMLRVMGDQLDLAYLLRWSAAIGVGDLWAAMWDEHSKLAAR